MDFVIPYRYVEIEPRSERSSQKLLHLGRRDYVLGLVGGEFVFGEGGGGGWRILGSRGLLLCCWRLGCAAWHFSAADAGR